MTAILRTNEVDVMPISKKGVGELVRDRRNQLSMSLQRLAELVGCAKGYLSQIENDRRPNPPSDSVLGRIEEALRITRGTLIEAARWQSTPETVRREVESLEVKQRAARRLAEIVAGGNFGDGRQGGDDRLDVAFRSGELHRLVEVLSPSSISPDASVPHREVPLINSVTAGYPCEFTDLGYPAKIADEYVRVPDLDDADAFAARVVGDSMEPEYREGDVVVFSPTREVREGDDCFVRLEHDAQTTFKRIYFERSDGIERIRLQPLNSRYAPSVHLREEVAGLYVAVSVTRKIS